MFHDALWHFEIDGLWQEVVYLMALLAQHNKIRDALPPKPFIGAMVDLEPIRGEAQRTAVIPKHQRHFALMVPGFGL